MNGKGVVVLSLCVILILRLVSMGLMGLMPQDAYYYYVYGEHLSYSYYDHPPLVGYMLRLFKELFGKSVFTIKLADTVISALTIAVFYKLSLYFLSPHQARKSLVSFAGVHTRCSALIILVFVPYHAVQCYFQRKKNLLDLVRIDDGTGF